MQLQYNDYSINIAANGQLSLLNLTDGTRFIQEKSPYPISNIHAEGDSITYDIAVGDLVVHATAMFADSGELNITLEAEGPLPAAFNYPPPWMPEDGDIAILPFCEGVAVPVNDVSFDKYIPEEGFKTYFPQMAFLAFIRGNRCIATAIQDAADTLMTVGRNEQKLVTAGFTWLPSKGQFAYPRRLTYFFGTSLSDAAQQYRRWREAQHGWVVTLKEKAKRNPNVAKLAGAADIWLWDDNNMNRLYARPESSDITPRNPRKIAQDMLERNMTHVLWNAFEGETPEDCAYLKAQGFLVGKYDIYRDVLPKTLVDVAVPYRRDRSVNTRHWPDIVRINEKGEYAKAWKIHGTDGNMYDQHSVCEICALRLTMENVPPDVKRVGYTSRLIDVQAGTQLNECYDPIHPATRADSLRYINTQNRFLADMGLVVGVEVGQEGAARDFHYSEGLMSLPLFRAEDAGRRMTTQYKGEDIPPQITRYMLNPMYRIPLWELIYHDCTVSYWYWGDSSNSCPELMPRRDLFNALYGLPPLYSLNATQWEELKDDIAASYHRATPVALMTAYAKMTAFEWLTPDRMVQKTTFDNKVSVIVNFSSQPYVVSASVTVQPQTAFVTTPEKTFVI